jgi:hypothetical protein
LTGRACGGALDYGLIFLLLFFFIFFPAPTDREKEYEQE